MTFLVVNRRTRNRVARWFIFQTKNHNSGKFWGPWIRKGWYIKYPSGVYYSHLVYFIATWKFSGILVKFPSFGTLCPEKSGNPDKKFGKFERKKYNSERLMPPH
jgi:hypothetical protein